MLLPNIKGDKAKSILSAFQKKVSDLDLVTIEENLAVSIGICEVDENCYLTDNEIEIKAAFAKKVAKGSGKNCISIIKGPDYRTCT